MKMVISGSGTSTGITFFDIKEERFLQTLLFQMAYQEVLLIQAPHLKLPKV